MSDIVNRVVIRPDSGDPVKIITGYVHNGINYSSEQDAHKRVFQDDLVDCEAIQIQGKWYKCTHDGETLSVDSVELSNEEVKGSIQVLWDTFGGTTNNKGYKVLDSHIGLIYGDSITMARAEKIFSRLEVKGFSSDNVVFGVGSYSYQMVSRDTLGFAMKATNININGTDYPLFKNPKTDDGTKKSAKGLLKVVTEFEGGAIKYTLNDNVTREEEDSVINSLTTLYENGKFMKTTTLEQIRSRIKNSLEIK